MIADLKEMRYLKERKKSVPFKVLNIFIIHLLIIIELYNTLV